MASSVITNNVTFRLNTERGITNIGSHPENDITIEDPRILPFHLMLDHRQKPYRIISLNPNSNITINGVEVSGDEPIEIMDLNSVKFNGFSIQIPSTNGGSEENSIMIVPPAAETEKLVTISQKAPQPAETKVTPAVADAMQPAPESFPFPPSKEDDIILLSLTESQCTVDVDQSAVYHLTVVNGGPIVASFDISINGVPEDWVEIEPRRINLNESGRAQVNIRLTPPRDPSSRAGVHPFSITVISPNYASNCGVINAQITINPYYQFALGGLNPRQKSTSWSKPAGEVTFPVKNQGNSLTSYRISAVDDENGIQFEFPQGTDTNLVKQSEVKVDAGETIDIPMILTPIKRTLIRMRGRHFNYNVTTQSMEDAAAMQTVSGSFISQPLFGFFSMVIAFLIVLTGAFFLLKPHIFEFSASKEVIETGQPVTLKWRVSLFTTDLNIQGVADKITGAQNQIDITPTSTATTYTLVAGNWLSHLLRMENIRSDPVTVLMIPNSPVISTFSLDKTEIFQGDTVNIKWSVNNADEVTLTIDGVTTTLTPDKFNGEQQVTLRNDSLIVLEAKNSSGSVVKSEYVKAKIPSITIDEFTLSKTTITQGESVTIRWKVSGTGVDSVTISPFTNPLPLEGELTFFPKESMEFVMTVKNRDLEEIRLLPVGVLAPGAAPVAPTINFFKAAPQTLVGNGTAEFSWSVSGIIDKVEITNAHGVIKSGLAAQGFISIPVSGTTNYVLTAYNQSVSSASILEVTVNPTLMNTQVQINSTVPSTSVQRGDSIIVYFSVKPIKDGVVVKDVINAGLPEVSGKVVVTDGFDTCEAELPQTSCQLTLNTSSANKKLTATYSGDSNYARRTSDPYPSTTVFNVVGEPARFVSIPAFSASPIYTGQSTRVSFTLEPVDSTETDPVTGNVEIWEVAGGVEVEPVLCKTTLHSVTGYPTQGAGECDIQFSTAGVKMVRVKYMGNQIYDGIIVSSPDMPYLAVNPANTLTAITSNLGTISVVGEPIDIGFLVHTVLPGTGFPTGQVRIFNNSGNECHGDLTDGLGNCSLTFTNAGNWNVSAHYISDGNYNSSDAFSIQHTVINASTAIKINSISPANAQVGQQVTVDFSIPVLAPGSGTPTGLVEVHVNGVDFCSMTNVTTGSGQCTGTLQNSGTVAFRALYNGTPNFASSTSDTVNYTVQKAPTKTSITGQTPSPSAIDETVTFSFTVDTVASTLLKPMGNVIVTANTGESCTGIVSRTNPTGSCTITFKTEGSRTVTASFQENTNYGASASSPVTQIVKRNSTVTIISGSPNTSIIDQEVTFAFTVVSTTSGLDTPTGNVTVTAATGETCTGTVAQGQCKISFASQGTKSVTASYSGDSIFKGSTSAPLSYVVSPADSKTTIIEYPSSAYVGLSFTVKVKVESIQATTQSPTGTVRVLSSTTEYCDITLSNGTGQCDLILVNQGSRSVTAVYNDNSSSPRFKSSTSAAVIIPVTKASTVTTITGTSPSGDPPEALVGQAITVYFKVASLNSTTNPTPGTVTVKATDSAAVASEVCTGTSDASGAGQCQIKLASKGIRQITAQYAGTSNFNGSSSDPKNITINQAETTTTLTFSPESTVVGQTATLSFIVSANSPGSGIPSGTVSISGKIGTGTAVTLCNAVSLNPVDGKGTCSYAFANAGNWNLTASYSGDAVGNYAISSDSLQHTVSAAQTETSLDTVSPASVVVGNPVTFGFSASSVAPGTAVPTGTVQILGTLQPSGTEQILCSGSLNASGSGSCSYTFPKYGTYGIRATLVKNSNFDTSTSASQDLAVNGLDPTISLKSPASSTLHIDQSQTYTAVVTETNSTYDLTAGVTIIATMGTDTIKCTDSTLDSNDEGSCSLLLNKTGTWTIVAHYDGDDHFIPKDSSSTTITVTQYDTTIAFTQTPYDSINNGASKTFEVAITPSQGSGSPAATLSGTVTVTASLAGADPAVTKNCSSTTFTSGKASCSIVFTQPGNWTISAVYSGNAAFTTSSTSSNPTLTVRYDTSISVESVSPLQVGSVTFSSTVTPVDTTQYPLTGITILAQKNGSTDQTCSPSMLFSGRGECTISFDKSGTWTVIATFVGDNTFKASTSQISVTIP